MTTARQDGTPTVTDDVDLDVPADPAYLAVVRTATAGLGARLDLTLDAIEDLRIAVDEACALLLDGSTHPDRILHTSFSVSDDGLSVTIHGPARVLPRETNFAWSVLDALVGGVETGRSGDGNWIRLTYVPGRGTD